MCPKKGSQRSSSKVRTYQIEARRIQRQDDVQATECRPKRLLRMAQDPSFKPRKRGCPSVAINPNIV